MVASWIQFHTDSDLELEKLKARQLKRMCSHARERQSNALDKSIPVLLLVCSELIRKQENLQAVWTAAS